MNLFSLLGNAGTIISAVEGIEDIVSRVVKRDNKMPSADDLKQALEIVRKLLDSGVIDIEGVDERALSQTLLKVEDNLLAVVDLATRNLSYWGDLKGRQGSSTPAPAPEAPPADGKTDPVVKS